jgi:hypothetical protein
MQAPPPHTPTHTPNKEGPFLPWLKTQGLLGPTSVSRGYDQICRKDHKSQQV